MEFANQTVEARFSERVWLFVREVGKSVGRSRGESRGYHSRFGRGGTFRCAYVGLGRCVLPALMGRRTVALSVCQFRFLIRLRENEGGFFCPQQRIHRLFAERMRAFMKEKTTKPLWTRDFTILTLGSVVSMLGSTLSWFAISIMVLDYTGSTFLYVLFNVCFQLPGLILPLLAGPYLDRMSRKKAIYGLDFCSATIYGVITVLLWRGWFSYGVLLVCGMVIGGINSVYGVAWESFYPNLISEGNFEKAYSVSGLLSDLTGLAYPLGALCYELVGAVPLFALTAAAFFVAACFETTISHRETHMAQAKKADGAGVLRQFGLDFREGLTYIKSEKGLLCITLYFTMSSFVGGGSGNLQLPFFNDNPERFAVWGLAGATLYTVLSNFTTAGRLLGGAIHYKVKIPPKKKFILALCIYFAVNLMDGVILWMPIPVMAVLFFLDGVLGVTSYNIRVSATQSYIPDTKRARFSGAFSMLCTVGSIVGSLVGGALAEGLPERWVITLLSAVGVLSVYLFIFRGREQVAAIYNREM